MTDIDSDLVRALVAEQFPEWGGLPVRPVARQGWDNRTFRLGDELAVRLPSAEGYVAAVEKEDRCLPVLARHLTMPVPHVVATGRPGAGYPYPWSVRRWLPGDTVEAALDIDRARLARDLGAFLTGLREVPDEHGPAAGHHSYYRGRHPGVYGDQVRRALDTLGDRVDAAACRAVWEDALRSSWDAPPYFTGEERGVFREAAGLPDDAWRRARGWALWKALATMAGLSSPDPDGFQERVLRRVLDDPLTD